MMRLSIQRLRWVLIAGTLLLIVVLAAYIGYGRYRAIKAYQHILAHSGVTLTHDSNGVTYSQSVQGRKIFTIRAKTESSLGNGKWALHDAEMLLYSRSGDIPDHIYGSEIEYDENDGIARAKGEVFMDLQPPQGFANGGHAVSDSTSNGAIKSAPMKAKPASPPIIHVRTSGLVYLRKLGVAATDQQVAFSYGDMQCTALGAEFNSGQSTLHLLANVHMDGLAHGKPLHVTATRADIDRNSDMANFAHPVVTTGDRSAKSDTAVLHLRKDGSIDHVQGMNHVVLSSATQQITANRLDAVLNLQSIPQSTRLSGDVLLIDTDPLRLTHGSASFVDVAFNAHGSPTSVVATGAAKLSMVDHKSNSQGLARSMVGAKIVALFTPGAQEASPHITEIHATGSAHAGGESVATPAKGAAVDKTSLPLKDIQVSADDIRLLFTNMLDGKAQPQKLYGTGHTVLQQNAPLGEEETSSGDTLEIVFASAPTHTANTTPDKMAMNIASAVQTGHVTIHDRDAAKIGYSKPGSTETSSISTGTADRAAFDGATQVLTLTGDAHLYGDSASLIAPTVSLDQRTQETEANGGVQATFQNVAASTARTFNASVGAKPAPTTHVLSSSAHFVHATQLASFNGTDAQPARMWQDASQVQAAILLFDGAKRTFSARPSRPGSLIHAIFASNPATPKQGASPRTGSIFRVASSKMDYNDMQREANFSGGVVIDGTMGEIRGQHAVVFLAPASKPQPDEQPTAVLQAQPSPLNGTIERVVVSGSVQMEQPGRNGTGEQLLYTAANNDYILTGTTSVLPHIVDAQQGNITGTTLLFSNAGSTIVVSGNPAAPRSKGGRVRTETHVSPGKEERQ
jgi:lipopolysaccharide export system protein LptA